MRTVKGGSMRNPLSDLDTIRHDSEDMLASRQEHGGATPSWVRMVLFAALCLLMGCARETLFRSNFDSTPVGQPPATVQDVGTATIDGPPGSVIVIAPPVSPSGKWVQISRPNGPEVAGLQGKFSQFRGDGVYTFSATMFMTSGSGVATIQFETFTNPSSFLHLDFMQDNQVRIDDNESTKFGSFPRNQPFIVQVILNINASASTANIVLSGAGASGERDYTIISPFQNVSRQFGAVRLWQGFPHTGAFDATIIAVTRKTN
jgi:hypothetical protein